MTLGGVTRTHMAAAQSPCASDRAHAPPHKQTRSALDASALLASARSTHCDRPEQKSNRPLAFRALLRRSSQIAAYRRISAHIAD